jgi:hypothetical protein
MRRRYKPSIPLGCGDESDVAIGLHIPMLCSFISDELVRNVVLSALTMGTVVRHTRACCLPLRSSPYAFSVA